MPVFHTDKLVHYSNIMHRCSETLTEKLQVAAEKKESFDIAPLIQVRSKGRKSNYEACFATKDVPTPDVPNSVLSSVCSRY